MKPLVTLYTRSGCCLCDKAKDVLLEVRQHAEFEYQEVDIDRDADLLALYNEEVPVIAINGANVFRYGVHLKEFLRKLAG
jgi:glutaredoxin